MTGELKIFQDSENLHCFMNLTGGRIKVETIKTLTIKPKSDLAHELPFSMNDRSEVCKNGRKSDF